MSARQIRFRAIFSNLQKNENIRESQTWGGWLFALLAAKSAGGVELFVG
jgi:hypothetical protein